MKVFYFGCPRREVGHYWHTPETPAKQSIYLAPFGSIDGVLAPRIGADRRRYPKQYDSREEVSQGQAVLVHTKGWTVIAYWDRSQDGRPGSNSAFVAEGAHTFEALLIAAKDQWPWVFERQAFEVTEYCDV